MWYDDIIIARPGVRKLYPQLQENVHHAQEILLRLLQQVIPGQPQKQIKTHEGVYTSSE